MLTDRHIHTQRQNDYRNPMAHAQGVNNNPLRLKKFPLEFVESTLNTKKQPRLVDLDWPTFPCMSLYCHDVLRVISHARPSCFKHATKKAGNWRSNFVSIFTCVHVCDLLGSMIDTIMSRAVPDTLS